MNHIEISKDVKIPVLGFGVFQIPLRTNSRSGYRSN